MLKYLEIKCKRIALEWTQEELANRCGVSTSTISVYERGEPVSFSVAKNIVTTVLGYMEYIKRNDEVEYNRILLIANALGLKYQIPEERLRTEAYMNVNLGYLQMAEMNALNKENKKFL